MKVISERSTTFYGGSISLKRNKQLTQNGWSFRVLQVKTSKYSFNSFDTVQITLKKTFR